jgi:predicted Co/Zn/Cd cation transporter (cation efflux family)
MRFACWVIKDTDTHSEYLIIIAFQRQQWLMRTCLHISLLVESLLCFHCGISDLHSNQDSY